MEGFILTEAAKLALAWLLLLWLSNLSFFSVINVSPKGFQQCCPVHAALSAALERRSQREVWTAYILTPACSSKRCCYYCYLFPVIGLPLEERQTARAHAEDAQPRKGGQESWPNQPLQNFQASHSFHWLWKLHVQVPTVYDGFPPEGNVGECPCALASLTNSVLTSE